MPVPCDIGKLFKFLAGPYVTCVFTLESYDDKNCTNNIRLAQYNKKLVITNNEWVEWGARQL